MAEKLVTYTDLGPRDISRGHSLFIRLFARILALAVLPAALAIFLSAGARQNFFYEHKEILLVGMFAVVAGCSFILSRSITRPLVLLISAIRSISAGDLQARIPLDRKDEIGNLARFFNAMVEKFAETQERNLALSRIKSQFVSVAAHQLRTPLSELKWTMRLLLDEDVGNLSLEQQKYLERGYQTNEHMIELVNDLLDVSRIEEGKFGFTFREVFITEVVKKAVGKITLEAQQQDIKITTKIQVPETLKLIADPERLHTALVNMLENAVRYNNEGGEVVVTMELENEFVRVSIEDTGIGIPEPEADKIFSKFYRAANALRRETEGSGLGLFIAQNIINRHGGKVWFKSLENKGTSIFFTLPIKEGHV